METAAPASPTTPLSTGFRLLRTGEEGLRRMLHSIQSARESVRLETYIYDSSPVGERFRAALVQACQRGLRVEVIVDAMGSVNLSDSFWDPLRQAGGKFAWFNPITLRRWSYRDHRKMVICDNQMAFIGGFNIAAEYDGDGVAEGWRDLGLEITGAPVRELASSFDEFFSRADFQHPRLQRLRRAPNKVAAGPNWQLLLNGPGRQDNVLRATLAGDLSTARSVQIISAYFLPTRRLRNALSQVVASGGRVQLILAGKSDVLLSQLASRRLYRIFLRAGVEIYEYQPQILHAKLFIMDNTVYVGSANLDIRSLRINYELLARVVDPRLAEKARELFRGDLPHCRRIDPVTWNKSRTFWGKLREDWAYFLLARIDPYVARQQWKAFR